MKMLKTLKLTVCLSTLMAMPAVAETLITIPQLSDGVLTSIAAISGTNGGLFEQTGTSIGSTSLAVMAPNTSAASGGTALPEYFDAAPIVTQCVYDGVGCSGGGEQVYDAAGNALYQAPWDHNGTGVATATNIENNDYYDYAYDAEGNKILVDYQWGNGEQYYATIYNYSPTYTSDQIQNTTGTVAAQASSVAGVDSLTNMSALVLNNLTLSTDAALNVLEGTTFATQTATAYGSTSTAEMTLPNVGGDVTTISNTAMGTLNTISVTIAGANTLN